MLAWKLESLTEERSQALIRFPHSQYTMSSSFLAQQPDCIAARLVGIMMMQINVHKCIKVGNWTWYANPVFQSALKTDLFIKTQQFQLLSEFTKSDLCRSKLFVRLEANTHFLALNAYSLTYFQVLLHGEIWYVWWKCTHFFECQCSCKLLLHKACAVSFQRWAEAVQ